MTKEEIIRAGLPENPTECFVRLQRSKKRHSSIVIINVRQDVYYEIMLVCLSGLCHVVTEIAIVIIKFTNQQFLTARHAATVKKGCTFV